MKQQKLRLERQRDFLAGIKGIMAGDWFHVIPDYVTYLWTRLA